MTANDADDRHGDTVSAILRVIVDEFADELDIPADPRQLTEEVLLGEEGLGLDSILLIDACVAFEDEFGVSIPDDDLFELAERSVGQIAEYLNARRAFGSSTASF